MRASAIEFRLRMVINGIIIILGFWAPWIEAWHIGRRITLLEWLALEIGRAGIASFSTATRALLVIAMLVGAKAVLFRVWGSAYLGPNTVSNVNMVAGQVMAEGPYRYLRNPLYIGLWCMVIALAFLMPVSGAVFAVVLIALFAMRLTLAEEAFLTTTARRALRGIHARSALALFHGCAARPRREVRRPTGYAHHSRSSHPSASWSRSGSSGATMIWSSRGASSSSSSARRLWCARFLPQLPVSSESAN